MVVAGGTDGRTSDFILKICARKCKKNMIGRRVEERGGSKTTTEIHSTICDED